MKTAFVHAIVFSIVGLTFSASTAFKQISGSCLLNPDPGPCKSVQTRYYFDRAADQCQKFAYGGCYGNRNNFETLEDCQASCGKSTSGPADGIIAPCHYHGCTPEMLNCPPGTGLATNENNCQLCECAEQPIACPLHSCTKETLGCSGELAKNENGCDLCECAAVVIEPKKRADQQDGDVCLLIPDPGPCKSVQTRYYFDRAADQCQKFVYGGCYGNRNNFETLEDCQASCGKSTSGPADGIIAPCHYHSCTPEMLNCPPGTGLATNENNCQLCECAEQPIACPLHSCTKETLKCSGELAKNENGCDLCECAAVVIEPEKRVGQQDRDACLLIPDPGPCKLIQTRYYFDRAASQCQKFAYGGCHGNQNNFETLEDCQATCGPSDEIIAPCPYHSCTPEMLNCPPGTGLATNENNCQLCECAEQPIACPLHSCTKETLKCSGELAKNENGCDLCECAAIPCPSHSCTKEKLGCSGELKKTENGCDLCECEAVVIEPEDKTPDAEHDRGVCLLIPDPGPCKLVQTRYYFDRAADQCQKFAYGGCHGNQNNFEKLEECQAVCETRSVESADVVPLAPCPLHSCTAENLNCAEGTGLVTNENNCELCICKVPGTKAPVPCPAHSCTKENLGCVGELAKDSNNCDLCQCADVSNKRKRFEEALKELQKTQ